MGARIVHWDPEAGQATARKGRKEFVAKRWGKVYIEVLYRGR
jgi:hypothetical protein